MLTESELFNKFKEFRKLVFNEEKVIFTELCTDITRSMISESVET